MECVLSDYVQPNQDEIFDQQFLRANAMDDEGLMAELLGLYMRQSTMLLKQLMVEQDLEKVAHIAHTLKGAANAVGVFQVAMVASDLEHIAERGDLQAFDMLDVLENRVLEAQEVVKPFANVA